MADGAVQRNRSDARGLTTGPVTLRQVAERAGVSPAAVSRAYQADAPISDMMRARVHEAANELGYRPNRLAAGLAGGRTGLVGLIVDRFDDLATLQMIGLVSDELRGAGLGVMLISAGDDDSGVRTLQDARDYGLEGLILLSHTITRPFLRQMERADLPVIHAFELRSASPQLSQAGVRDVLAARLALMTLHERGYVRIGLIAGPKDSRQHRDLVPGFQTTADRHGIAFDIRHVPDWTADAGAEAARHLIETGRCTGLVCATDTLAIGALGAVRELGRDVPNDVGVIGYDDGPMSNWAGIRLTTVAFPRPEIARACVSQFLTQRDDPEAEPAAHVVQPQLIERGTLRPESA